MIIGLIGFIGAGKGTVADILVEKKGFTKLSFADTVKDATAAIFGWPRHLLEGDTKESREWREAPDAWWSDKFGYEFSPRKALQLMGTEAGRNVFHPDLWIFALEKKLELYPNVVIADTRFPNEIDFIRSKGGFVVRVTRGPDPEWYDTALVANAIPEWGNAEDTKRRREAGSYLNDLKIHYSEWAWIGQPTDYILHNEGTLTMLEADMNHMISVFTGPKNPATMNV
jgi:hypothetical protein